MLTGIGLLVFMAGICCGLLVFSIVLSADQRQLMHALFHQTHSEPQNPITSFHQATSTDTHLPVSPQLSAHLSSQQVASSKLSQGSFSAECMHALGGGLVGKGGSFMHFPPACQEELEEYFMDGGQYFAEVAAVAESAKAYFIDLARVKTPNRRQVSTHVECRVIIPCPPSRITMHACSMVIMHCSKLLYYVLLYNVYPWH